MRKSRDRTEGREDATENLEATATGVCDRRRLVLHVAGAGELRSHALPPGRELVIGRIPEVDVQIDATGISRRHARLRTGPPVSIEDLRSANGTRVGGRRIAPGEAVPVGLGEPIRVGTVILFTMLVAAERDAAGRPPARGEAAGTARALDTPIVVRSAAMVEIHERVVRIAASPISVLLLGETGVGKEVMAEEIHRRSPRADKPFLRLNCAALSEQLLESELFGHEKGAFTGAVQAKPGLLETADEGTVFLDEAGELSSSTQVKLLRVLEERRVTRVGGLRAHPIDVRFVAATNRDLELEIARGTFRRDLFFRLNGISITIPPLRERKEEIEGLARLFLERMSAELGLKAARPLSAEALALLREHPWPGNIRELRNAVERAAVLCLDDTIGPEHLLIERPSAASAAAPAPQASSATPVSVAFGEAESGEPRAPDGASARGSVSPLRGDLEALERRRIIEALETCGGNQSKAARLLGVSRNTLLARIALYGLPRPRGPREAG